MKSLLKKLLLILGALVLVVVLLVSGALVYSLTYSIPQSHV